MRNEFSEVYIDNSVLIGTGKILSHPETLSAYTLLDLETFCEAFILYDKVSSLRGQTSRILNGCLQLEDFKNFKRFFELSSAGMFSVKESKQNFGAYWYELDDIKDRILNEDMKKAITKYAGSTYGNDLQVETYFQKSGSFMGTGNIETVLQREEIDLRYIINSTFTYLANSMFEGKPYLASSIRSPLVSVYCKEMKPRSISIVNEYLTSIETKKRKQIEKVLNYFGNIDCRLYLPPLFKMVLKESSNINDIIPSMLKIRRQPDVILFRKYCKKIQMAQRKGNVNRLYKTIEEVNAFKSELNKSKDLNRRIN